MQKVLTPPVTGRGKPDRASALRTLNAFAIDVMAIRTAEDLFWYVAQNVVGRLNFVDCVIYEAEGTALKQVAALGEKNPYGRTILNPLRIPFGQGITGRVAETGEAIIVDDLLEDRNYIPDAQPARSEICVPLVSQGRIVGVIDSEHPEIGAFGTAELEILTTVAAMTSAKLDLLAEAERSSQRYGDLVEAHAQLTREGDSRRALEAELFEARKMEAIGRLTGGFAHGFNNLLTVVAGNLELLGIHLPDGEARTYLDAASHAVDRGANLIQNMLAFAQRARLEPESVDINRFVVESCNQNREAAGTEVEFELTAQPWPILVDPVAAEIAFLNLLLNANDAMPEGGSLRIRTENLIHNPGSDPALAMDLAPGRYVRLSITDRGTGIPEDALPRIFDPFFTTKPVGRGTGLGLSMVMGFMRQSGGWVRAVEGDDGLGTTLELYFPAFSEVHDVAEGP